MEEQIIAELEERAEELLPMVIEKAPVDGRGKFYLGVFLVAAGSALVSGTATYLVTKKLLEKKYDERLEEELAKTKQFLSKTQKTGDYETVEGAAAALGVDAPESAKQAMVSYSRSGETIVVEDSEPEVLEDGSERVIHRNIFVDGKPFDPDDNQFDSTERDESGPYVISEEEFDENAMEFTQLQVTYYAGDDVLCMENDEVIEDMEATVGEANLKKFGVGTKSKHLVHIRNPITEIDYEVAKSDGKYAREVLGFDDEPELRHSHGGHRRRVMDD